jgi:hypothetical protein
MPKALTLAEKKEKALAKKVAVTAEEKESVAIVKTVEAVNEATGVAEVVAVKKTRKKRGSFNGTEGKMTVAHGIPGFHLHWLNDTAGRITQALDSGYEFVEPQEVGGVSNSNVTNRNTDLGEKVRVLAGHDDQGLPLFAYLMKIEQDWYDEDQQAVQGRNDKIDKAIRTGKIVGDGKDTDGFYLPSGGIKMQT